MKLDYRLGIGTKINAIVAIVIVTAISVVVIIATNLFKDDSLEKAQQTNIDAAENLANQTFTVFEDLTDKLGLMAQFSTNSLTEDEAQRGISSILGGDDELIGFYAYKEDNKGIFRKSHQVLSETAIVEFGIDQTYHESTVTRVFFEKEKLSPEEIVIFNASPYSKFPMISIGLLTVSESASSIRGSKQTKWFFRLDVRQEALVKLLLNAKKGETAFIVDKKGRILAHSDHSFQEDVMKNSNFSELPIVKQLLVSSIDNHQMEYENWNGELMLGAFKKVKVASIGAVASVHKQHALAAVYRIRYRAFYIMIISICAAFLINYIFSSSITRPILSLYEATDEIVNGNFDVSVPTDGSDEVGALSRGFMNMVSGLRERDKLKGAFSKFHSKEMAEKLLTGDIKLGGERTTATVFFSDIRGFTSMSEKMTPDEVVSMLNEYLTEMVRIIFKWHGVVDKYVGDAIMAVWGVPEKTDTDAYNAVRAALEMRAYMVEFNKKRKTEGKDELKIGMGIHTGEVVAGNIGSEERLEYTMIGDTVNQAARLEAANKPLKSDFIISAKTAEIVKSHGVELGPELHIKAKGKSEALGVYKVIGYKNEDGKLITSLNQNKIDEIKNQSQEVVSFEEAKVQSADNVSSNSESANPSPVPSVPYVPSPQSMQNANVPPGVERFFISSGLDTEDVFGPWNRDQIQQALAAGQIQYNYMALREGDSEPVLLTHIPGISRRVGAPPPNPFSSPPPPPPKTMEHGEWYYLDGSGQQIGPLSETDIRVALLKGQISSTTYIWKSDMPNWAPLYQVPGFDRRLGSNPFKKPA